MTAHNGNGAADDPAERIRRHMSAVRAQMAQDADHVADATRTMTDWRTYVRRYPWLFVGGAAALGYIMIPRRPTVVTLDPEVLRQLAGRPVNVAPQAPRPSLFASMLSMAVSLGARHVMQHVSHMMTNYGQQSSASNAQDGRGPAADSHNQGADDAATR